MNIIKTALFTGLVLLSAPAMQQKEIVINKGNENYLTISWDFVSTNKHFSIENEDNGLIRDAFIVSKNLHGTNDYYWYTLDIEGWQNEDEHFFNFRMGL